MSEYNSCPKCFNYIDEFNSDKTLIHRVRGELGTDSNGDPLPFWSDDPIYTPLGLAGEDYTGMTIPNSVHITELQDYYASLEEEILGSENQSMFLSIEGKNLTKHLYIEQLRVSIENLLDNLGLTLTDYFKYDRHGNDTGLIQTDWTDVNRIDRGELPNPEDFNYIAGSTVPLLPSNNLIKAIHIEELRIGISAFSEWMETWTHHVISFESIPPSEPSKYDSYIVREAVVDQESMGDWLHHVNDIAEWNGQEWEYYTPSIPDVRPDFDLTWVKNLGAFYRFDGTDWQEELDNEVALEYISGEDITLPAWYRQSFRGGFATYMKNDHLWSGSLVSLVGFPAWKYYNPPLAGDGNGVAEFKFEILENSKLHIYTHTTSHVGRQLDIPFDAKANANQIVYIDQNLLPDTHLITSGILDIAGTHSININEIYNGRYWVYCHVALKVYFWNPLTCNSILMTFIKHAPNIELEEDTVSNIEMDWTNINRNIYDDVQNIIDSDELIVGTIDDYKIHKVEIEIRNDSYIAMGTGDVDLTCDLTLNEIKFSPIVPTIE